VSFAGESVRVVILGRNEIYILRKEKTNKPDKHIKTIDFTRQRKRLDFRRD
jgi:hypothetical protein